MKNEQKTEQKAAGIEEHEKEENSNLIKNFEEEIESIDEKEGHPDRIQGKLNSILGRLRNDLPNKFKDLHDINLLKRGFIISDWKDEVTKIKKDWLARLLDYKQENETDRKIAELVETLQRLQAEFENYRKYVEKQKSEFIKYAHEDLVIKLLPILDSFEMALKSTADKEKFVRGVELIFSQLYQILKNEGLKPIDALKKQFDPYKHEVLLTQESDKEEGTILEELQKGYTLGDKVIRHSKVKIAKNANKKADASK